MNQNFCLEHSLPISMLLLTNNTAQLLCEGCHSALIKRNKKLELDKIIHLSKAMNSASYFLSKTQIRDDFPEFLTQMQNDEFTKQAIILIRELEAMLQDLKNQVKSFDLSRQQIEEQLKHTIKFNQFQELIRMLDQNNQDIINQIEIQLLRYCNSIKKDQVAQFLQTQVKYPHVPQIQLNVEEFNSLVNKLNLISVPKQIQSSLLSDSYNKKLFDYIEGESKQKIVNTKLIYLGTRDGLNANAYWGKVNGKSNLLFVFQTGNNSHSIFGAYSPCKWIDIGQYQADNTGTSFIFSQTHNEIYPIKKEKKHKAIYGSSKSGPIFGKNDLQIDADFTQGYCHLGLVYNWDKSQGQKTTHLFGGFLPVIKECEIYEIMYK